MFKKKSNSTPIILFTLLALLWAAEVIFFYESLTSAEEERDRLVAQEEEMTEKYAKLKREAEHLREYTNKMLNDREFIEQEARERLGVAHEGEIVIRAAEH